MALMKQECTAGLGAGVDGTHAEGPTSERFIAMAVMMGNVAVTCDEVVRRGSQALPTSRSVAVRCKEGSPETKMGQVRDEARCRIKDKATEHPNRSSTTAYSSRGLRNAGKAK